MIESQPKRSTKTSEKVKNRNGHKCMSSDYNVLSDSPGQEKRNLCLILI